MPIIDQVISYAADICLGGAFLGCVFTALAGVLTLRFGRDVREASQARQAAKPVPVSILIPLCGDEVGLETRLRALCTQDYAAPVQVLCGVRDPADSAIPVAEKLAAELPARALELHVDPRLHGRNPKISNLMNTLERARHDTIVMIDSDVTVEPGYLARVVDELQRPEVGAVTCFYYGIAEGGLWAKLAAMAINLQFLPSAILALRFGLARPCFGATIAISRDMLHEIGGLGRFADQLWDDYAIGEAVRAAGHRVAVPALALGHVCADASARELFAHQLRYARTIASIDPAGNAGAIISRPFPLALLALLLGGGQTAVGLGLIALAVRYGLFACIARRFPASSNSYWLLPLRDLAAFAIYVMSFFGGTVIWRGQRYRVRSDDTLLQASQ
jgi:ceramide glucosyltransferase